MSYIDVKKIIENSRFSEQEIADHLFPGHKHAYLALRRVMLNAGLLDSKQVSKLALLTGVPIAEMYEGGTWKQKTSKNIHYFTNGDYTAELNIDTWVTKIFHKRSLFHESVIHSGSTPLSDYLKKIQSLIDKHN